MADINIGAILEALNNKIDRDGHNAQSPCAVVVDKQDPTSANNYTWYRKWSDGWVEQGQSCVAAADQVIQITFPVEMATQENYNLVIGRHIYQITAVQVNDYFMGTVQHTSTGFRMSDKWGHTYAWSWQVSGIAA